jgi:hypothetical protein
MILILPFFEPTEYSIHFFLPQIEGNSYSTGGVPRLIDRAIACGILFDEGKTGSSFSCPYVRIVDDNTDFGDLI